MVKEPPHNFHIPVLGIGYSIDTPVKVAHLGITSVISLLDDMLMEKLREFHCRRTGRPFEAISEKVEDFRAMRITAYLDMVHDLARERFEEMKNSIDQKMGDFRRYIDLLHESSGIRKKFEKIRDEWNSIDVKAWIHENLSMGSIDVNIMTKVDKENYRDRQKLPPMYNDSHAALRGFAESSLESSVVLSAGMNPRLYNYLESLDAFFPGPDLTFRKKITLKVSDYRSALIQGKYLAKKGLWISEFRIESGLNCGGHAFPTKGYLLGPVLEEFRENRDELAQSLFGLFRDALLAKGKPCPVQAPPIRITVQGGVGTAEEHRFLLEQYGMDSVGWGTPFLLVPEVVNVDRKTLDMLCEAREEDLYLSDISPLGIPFNNLRGNTKDLEKEEYIRRDTPGNPCPKRYAALSSEYGEPTLCTASRKYQKKKIGELAATTTGADFQAAYEQTTNKSCICVGLGTSALIVNNLDTRVEKEGVSICPGPNMAYFSDELSLESIVGHIYGKRNVIRRTDRPHMFLKELSLYVDYLRKTVKENPVPWSGKQTEYFREFRDNLLSGIQYYRELVRTTVSKLTDSPGPMLAELSRQERHIRKIDLDRGDEKD